MKKNHGFALVETLLIILILAVAGFGGYYVWNNQHNKTPASQTHTPVANSQSNPNSNASQSYLTIKEWGVKIPISRNLEGIYYTLSSPPSTATFSTAKLDSISGSCKSNSLYVVRGRALDSVPTEEGPGETFQEAYSNALGYKNQTARGVAASLDGYYYVVPGLAGASCVSSASDTETETNIILDMVKAVNSLTNL